MDANTAYDTLKDLPLDSVVSVSYVPGRRPSARAIEEAARAIESGISPRQFTGTFKGVSKTKRNEVVFTLWVEERDSIAADGTKTPGAYRAFNPSLGRLLSLEVVQRAPAAS